MECTYNMEVNPRNTQNTRSPKFSPPKSPVGGLPDCLQAIYPIVC